VKRLVALAGLWWVFAGYEHGSWWIGAPAILAALWLAGGRSAQTKLRFSEIARFAGFFLRGSIRGGIDVASRVLSPSLPIAPGFVRYHLEGGETEPSVQLFLGAISLLPGTLAVAIEGRTATVHALDRNLASNESLGLLEARARGVFPAGVELS
jgi:multicomponent Na+:H+ antiporter subunit E